MIIKFLNWKTRLLLAGATLVAAVSLLPKVSPAESGASPETYDVVVYEGTPGGVMAAVAAARQGHSVLLTEMNNHVGGVVAGGLTASDLGNRASIGGLSNEFFERIVKYYTDKYGADSKQVKACRAGEYFEPSIAEKVYDEMLAEAHVKVLKKLRLHSTKLDDKGNITAIVLDDLANGGTKTVKGRIFVDASYEGDLLAQSKVPYTSGREGHDEYHESLAGVGSGPNRGKADKLTMSYNYRVNITPVLENRVLFPKPDHYDPAPAYNVRGKSIKARNLTEFIQLFASGPGRAGPNDKLDTNWFDFAGSSHGYAEGDWKKRDELAAAVRDFALSELYYYQNDPDLPKAFHDDMQHWGLPKDEFTDTGHFPFQFYVREARRMIGKDVLQEKDLTQEIYKPDGVCSGSYGVDCHIVQYLDIDGKKVPDTTPHTYVPTYDIPYGVLVPADKPGLPTNLLVPVCCSASHVAYCSLRMEPVYMMLGHAAGDAAHLALKKGTSVQKVDVKELRDMLRKENAQLDCAYRPQVKITWSPEHPKAGEKVQFKAETIEARDPLAQISWDFNGDGTVAAQGEAASFSFPLEKIYNVSLHVQDKAGRVRMVTAQVPVGAATKSDVTVDDFDYNVELSKGWDGDYPRLAGMKDQSDVYTGPAIHYLMVKKGVKIDGTAKFLPEIPREGRYAVCVGYRPAPHQSPSVNVTVQSSDGTATKTVDETKSSTPFPWVPVGEFHFKPGAGQFVQISNSDAEGRVVIDGVRLVWLGA